jgi:hypothetical protein
MMSASSELLALAGRAASSSCPACLPAREARTMLIEHDLTPHLLIALAPFLITLVVILLVVRAVSRRPQRRSTDDDTA